MNDEIYFQCRLQKGAAKQVSYIPGWAAKLGNHVELLPGSQDFWEVTAVSKPGRPLSALKADEQRRRDSDNFPSIA